MSIFDVKIEKVTLKSIFEKMQNELEPLKCTLPEALNGKIIEYKEERIIQILGSVNKKIKELGRSIEFRVDKIVDGFYSAVFFYKGRIIFNSRDFLKFNTYYGAYDFVKMIFVICEREDLLEMNYKDENFGVMMAKFALEICK